jgi:hypothetical protein
VKDTILLIFIISDFIETVDFPVDTISSYSLGSNLFEIDVTILQKNFPTPFTAEDLLFSFFKSLKIYKIKKK